MNEPASYPGILRQHLPETLDFLRRCIQVNSFSANRDGVNQVGQITASQFAKLGFRSERVPSATPAYGDHLVLSRPGKTSLTLGLITHLDTVFPPEEEQRNNFVWRPVGDRIYGPGAMDIKGGTAMIYLVLAGLRQANPSLFDEVSWTVLANSSEEVLSHDFGDLCLQRLPAETLAALVFEAEGRVGNTAALVVARKGRAAFRVRVEGRGAHAGGRHHHGANAIVQIARAIQRIAELTDYHQDLTFNVGIVSGGAAVNRVPHHAEAEVEMRAFKKDVYESGKRALLALRDDITVRAADDAYPCRVDIAVAHETPPWPENPRTQKLFALWQTTGRELGQTIVPQHRGGLSDGNLIAHALPALDGLGPWGENDHCSERSEDGSKDQEYVDVASFIPKAVLNAVSIERLIQQAKTR